MAALDLVFFGRGHAVVAEVVESEFRVGAVGDVAGVLLAPIPRSHLVLDTADGETEVTEERSHPVRVPLGEVVVDRDDVDAKAGERVEIDGQGRDKRFSLTGLHFRDHSAVEGDAADELDIEVNHFPWQGVVADLDLASRTCGGRRFSRPRRPRAGSAPGSSRGLSGTPLRSHGRQVLRLLDGLRESP